MGIKKFFKIKPPEEATPEVNRDELNELGIPVKNVNRKKKEKFAAYGTFAKDKGKDKFFAPPGYEKYAQQNEDDLDDLNKSDVDPAPEDPYLSAPSRNDFDPYARNNFGNSGGSSDPYNKGSAYGASGSPYANVASDPYSQQSNPYGNTGGSVSGPQDSGPSRYSNRGNPYDQTSNGRGSDPYQGANGITGSGSNDSPVDARRNPYGNNAESTERGAYAPSRSRSRNQNNEQNPKMNGGYNSSRSSPTGNPYGDAPYGSRGNTTSPTPSNAGNNRYGPTSGASSYIARQPSTGVSAKVPYGSTGPYGSSQDVPSGDAYGGNAASKSSNPYSTLRNDPYGGSLNQSTGGSAGVAYNNTSSRANLQPEPTNNADSFDFEAPSQVDDFTGVANDDDIDLNATLQEGGDDLNQSIYEGYGGRMQQQQQQVQPPQADQMHHEANRGYQTFDDVQRESQMRQQQEEDEEVDEVKQQIRFTKQSSVASTRNTLKMAQEAEAAGMNTLGMLGHQSEKLNNVERNLDLMKMQNRVAEDKVAELKKLNRNILAVHVSNPFNSKRRLREAEDKIKMQRVEDKMMQQQTNSELQQSTQRIEGAMMGAGNHTETVRERYQNKAIIDKAKRYQFENDEEDDEMELEIDKNLDKIGQVSSRLKKLALASGNEIDAQQDRVKDIEEDTDNLDIKIHLNTTRLTQIR